MHFKQIAVIDQVKSFTKSISDLKTLYHFQELVKIAIFARDEEKLLAAQGGFAVDLAIGFLSRKHDDCDVEVFRVDLPFFRNQLIKYGYEIGLHTGMSSEWTFNAYKYFPQMDDSVYFDFSGIEIVDNLVSDGSGDDKYVWPIKADHLFWERKVGGHSLTFLSPYLVYQFKKMQRRKDIERDKEDQDFCLLEKSYPDLKNIQY